MTSFDRPAESPLITGLVASPAVRWIALLGLCAAYLQGALTNAFDFPAAITEMQNFGLAPAGPFAKASHYHLYWGDDRAALLENVTNWPTYYPSSLDANEIVSEMLAH